MEKISIFVDVQNIYYTVKKGVLGHFDYNAFWKKINFCQVDIIAAIAYAVDRNDPQQIQFQNTLRKIGFHLKLKPYISRWDGSTKGDWDVGMTIDILEIAPSVERIIILSGDGDFETLVEKLISKHKIVHVYGVTHLTSHSLKKSASPFFPITKEYLMPR